MPDLKTRVAALKDIVDSYRCMDCDRLTIATIFNSLCENCQAEDNREAERIFLAEEIVDKIFERFNGEININIEPAIIDRIAERLLITKPKTKRKKESQ